MRPGMLMRWTDEYLERLPAAERQYWRGRIGVALGDNTVLWPGAGVTALDQLAAGVPGPVVEPAVRPPDRPLVADERITAGLCLLPDYVLDANGIAAVLDEHIGGSAIAVRHQVDPVAGPVLTITGGDAEEVLRILGGVPSLVPDHLDYWVIANQTLETAGNFAERRGQAPAAAAALLREAEGTLARGRWSQAERPQPVRRLHRRRR